MRSLSHLVVREQADRNHTVSGNYDSDSAHLGAAKVNAVDATILSLSTIGALTMIVPFFVSPNLRKLRHQLILGLAISDLVEAVVILITTTYVIGGGKLESYSPSCNAAGWLWETSTMSSSLWTLAIAVATYCILVHPLARLTSIISKPHAILFVGLVITIIAAINASLGLAFFGYANVGGFCYFDSSSGLFKDLDLFIPRGVVFIIVITIYTKMFFFFRRRPTGNVVSSPTVAPDEFAPGLRLCTSNLPTSVLNERPGANGKKRGLFLRMTDAVPSWDWFAVFRRWRNGGCERKASKDSGTTLVDTPLGKGIILKLGVAGRGGPGYGVGRNAGGDLKFKREGEEKPDEDAGAEMAVVRDNSKKGSEVSDPEDLESGRSVVDGDGKGVNGDKEKEGLDDEDEKLAKLDALRPVAGSLEDGVIPWSTQVQWNPEPAHVIINDPTTIGDVPPSAMDSGTGSEVDADAMGIPPSSSDSTIVSGTLSIPAQARLRLALNVSEKRTRGLSLSGMTPPSWRDSSVHPPSPPSPRTSAPPRPQTANSTCPQPEVRQHVHSPDSVCPLDCSAGSFSFARTAPASSPLAASSLAHLVPNSMPSSRRSSKVKEKDDSTGPSTSKASRPHTAPSFSSSSVSNRATLLPSQPHAEDTLFSFEQFLSFTEPAPSGLSSQRGSLSFVTPARPSQDHEGLKDLANPGDGERKAGGGVGDYEDLDLPPFATSDQQGDHRSSRNFFSKLFKHPLDRRRRSSRGTDVLESFGSYSIGEGTGTGSTSRRRLSAHEMNKRASILMTLYPCAYIILFSLSLARMINNLVGNSPNPGLQAVSRWAILAQGMVDAVIYCLVEWRFRRGARGRT